MNRLNQWLTLIANVGVLVGIVILAMEINQNTTALRIAALLDVSQAAAELSLSAVHSDYLPGIIIKDQTNVPLTPEENYRLQMYRFATMRNFETYYYQWRAGLIDDDLFSSRQNAFRSLLERESSQVWWETFKAYFSIDFRDYVESTFISPVDV